jgi:hypothetical protein
MADEKTGVKMIADVSHVDTYGDVVIGQPFIVTEEVARDIEATRRHLDGGDPAPAAPSVPVRGIPSDTTAGTQAGAFNVETATKAELVAEAERRGLTVTRADGGEGDPLVSDYRAALAG